MQYFAPFEVEVNDLYNYGFIFSNFKDRDNNFRRAINEEVEIDVNNK